mgnify:CR=1 FL=1
MSVEEALAMVDTVIKPERLNAVQELVLRQCWSGQTYQEIADGSGYDADYIRVVGSRLWHILSEVFGEKITKNNIRSVIRDRLREVELEELPEVELELPTEMELPRGVVPLNSSFYIERPPNDSLCYETVLQPGALIRIKAPRQMGKTSLMVRILDRARESGFRTVPLSLQQADANVFTDLERFLQWFCATVTRSLELPNRLGDYWDDIFGSSGNTTDYFENYLLKEIDTPMVLALDEVNLLFNYPAIATDFLGLLRAWYEKAKYGVTGSTIWQKLRLIIIHSTDVYITLHIHQSPFNVGLSIELPEFTKAQVQELARRHGIHWGSDDSSFDHVSLIMAKVGGNPSLLRVALYHLRRGDVTFEELLNSAVSESGIYHDDLRRQWWNLQHYPQLVAAYRNVVMSSQPVELEQKLAFKLQSLGLVQLHKQGAVPSCDLYRQYFSTHLG